MFIALKFNSSPSLPFLFSSAKHQLHIQLIMSKQPKPTGQQRIGHIYMSDELMANKQIEAPDFTKWITIYPAYMDSSRTVKQGRRVKKDLCIAGPNPVEIFVACRKLKVTALTERGSYPKSAWDQEPSAANFGEGLGRVRVRLLTEDGQVRTTPDNLEPLVNSGEKIINRMTLLKLICKVLPSVREELKLHLRPDPNIPPALTKPTKKNTLEDKKKTGSGKKKGKKGKRNR